MKNELGIIFHNSTHTLSGISKQAMQLPILSTTFSRMIPFLGVLKYIFFVK